MSRIIIKDLTFGYDSSPEDIFRNVNLNLDTSWKLGLIGRNGKGKTTLLRLLNQELKPRNGIINFPLLTEKFPFDVDNEDMLVIDVIKECVSSFKSIELKLDRLLNSDDEESSIEYSSLINHYNELGGYEIESEIEKEFMKMDLSNTLLTQIFSTLSGGEKTKIKIISLFLKKEKFLLIDEPTNHLDIFGRASLSNYLSKKSGYILVSHDQEFLDSCVDHILSINKNTIKINKCDFTTWDENRKNNEKNELVKKENLLSEANHLENSAAAARGWSLNKEKSKRSELDSGFAGRRSAKMMKRAKSMEQRKDKRLDEVKTLLKDYEERKSLEIKQDRLLHKKYLSINDVSYSINNNKILDSINLEVKQGDRIWIKGGNGAGKTTLLKIISGELSDYSGNIKKHCKINISHSHQDIEELELTVEEYRNSNNSDKTVFNVILDYFNMSIDYLDKKINTLSEGEKKKVEIAKTLSNRSEIYLWDEILNYMDIYFRIQIEEAIFKYSPTIIFVSHDEAFAKKIATKILELGAVYE